MTYVQLAVEHADHQTRYYPAERGWRVDAATRCIVIGRDLPRTYVPLDDVFAFTVERVGQADTDPAAAQHEIAFDHDGTWSIGHPAGCPGAAIGDCTIVRLAQQQITTDLGRQMAGGRWEVDVNTLGDLLLIGDRIDQDTPGPVSSPHLGSPADRAQDCPTCTGPVRETVGMVCQTCGTDYSTPADRAQDEPCGAACPNTSPALSCDLTAGHAGLCRAGAIRWQAERAEG